MDTFWTPDPDNPAVLGTKTSTFGEQRGPGTDPEDSGGFAYGGRSTNNDEPYVAIDPEWVKRGIVQPGDRFPIWNPQAPDNIVWGVVRDKGPSRSIEEQRGIGLDLAPSIISQLGIRPGDPVHFDISKASRMAPDQTTPEGARQSVANASQSNLTAQAGQQSGVQSTDTQAPATYKQYPDGSIDLGDGLTHFPSGIIQAQAGNSITQYIPDAQQKSGYRVHTFNVKPSSDTQIVADANTGGHFLVNKKTGESKPIELKGPDLGIPAGVTGESAMKGQPEQDALIAKKIANYDIPLPSGFALRSPYWQKIMALAGAYDPSFDASNYQTKLALRKQFTSGKYSMTRNSLNQAIEHLSELQDATDKLDNANWQPYNSIANYLISKKGDKRATNFNKAATAVQSELASVFKGTGATDQEIKAWRDNFNSSQSPDQLKDGIQEALRLMQGRLDSLQFIYSSGLGKPSDFPMMSNKAKDILVSKFGDAGKSLATMDEGGSPGVPQQQTVTGTGTAVDVGGKPFVIGKQYMNPKTGETRTFNGVDANGQPVWEK